MNIDFGVFHSLCFQDILDERRKKLVDKIDIVGYQAIESRVLYN